MQLETNSRRLKPDTTAGRVSPAGGALGPIERRGLGLSAKLLILTVLFVMLAEVLIFLPSVANFRVNWLVDRLTAARLASLAADTVPGREIPDPVRNELLMSAKVLSVAIRQNDMRRLVLPPSGQIAVMHSYDLRRSPEPRISTRAAEAYRFMVDGLATFLEPEGRIIRVVGHPALPPGQSFGVNDFIEIVLEEAPLKRAMVTYALNILGLSIIISAFAGALVYYTLDRLFVQPTMRLTRSMVSFSRNPENASLIITPSSRGDEIGTAERELARMQHELRHMLNQKSHLAALGLAVSKISHDLRNMLASAQLLSDRLGTIRDPAVQSFAPKLIASLDRAIALCNDTLRYGRAEETEPRRDRFALANLAEEVGEGLGLPRAGLDWIIDIEPGLEIDADRDHIYRVLNNLARNAVQAIESQPAGTLGEIRVRALREGDGIVCEVSDTGPGVPEKARANLFRAFQGTARKGGSGLGLAIAAELIAGHGGTLELIDTGAGATFRFTVPDRGDRI